MNTATGTTCLSPRIRFKEFGGAWNKVKLSEIAAHITRKNAAMESNLPLTISAERGLVSQTTYFNNRVAAQNVAHYYLVLNGEFAYNRSSSDGSPFGAVKRLDSFEKGVLSTLYTVFALKQESVDSDFLSVFFSTDLWHRDVRLRAAEGARNHGLLNISAGDFFETEIGLPFSKAEQHQIAMVFRDLDETIAATDARLEKLRQSKKSLLEKMFPRPGFSVPEIRFKGFEGEWKTRKLGEIATLITRKNTAMESNLPLTISAERGLISQTTYFNNRIAAQNVVHYYLILNGEFAYNRSSSDGSPFGAVKRLDSFGKGVLSTLYTVFALKEKTVDSDFLSVFFSTGLWHRDVRLRAAEGARNHGLLNISASDFFETEVLSPVSISEQQRIGSFFRELDKLIESVQKKAAKLRQVKSALLAEMFV